MSQFRVPVLETFSWQKQVKSFVNDAPADPTKGDRYIVGTPTPGDEFDGQAGMIAWYSGDTDGWQFDTPQKGWVTYLDDAGAFYKFDSTNWVESDIVTAALNVDSNRTDVYVPNGSAERPFKVFADAVVAANSGDVIILAPGVYVATALPDGVSVIGAGSAVTSMTGDLTCGADSMRLAGVTFAGQVILAAGSGETVELSDCPMSGGLMVNGACDVIGYGMKLDAVTGPALIMVDGNVKFDSAVMATADTSASTMLMAGGSFDAGSLNITNTSATAASVVSTGGVFKAALASIKNNGGGAAAVLDNSAAVTNPNILIGVQHKGGISCGDAHTIVQGVYSETPEEPTANDPTGTNLHLQHASQIRIDASQFSIQIPTDTDMNLQELLVWMDANFGGPGPLGVPSDGSYLDGLLEWTDQTAVNDAIDDINEVMADLAPPQATSLAGLSLTLNRTRQTAKLAGGLAEAWYNGGDSAGDTVSKIITSPSLTLATPDTEDAFGKGDETMLEAHYRAASADEFVALAEFDIPANFVEGVAGVSPRPANQDLTQWNKPGPSATGTGCKADGGDTSPSVSGTYPSTDKTQINFVGAGGGNLAILDVSKYNDFNMWQKMNASMSFSALPQGFHNFKMVHDVRGTLRETNEVEVIYDDAVSEVLSFSSVPAVVENTLASAKYLSGVRYYSTGDTFDVTATVANLFNKTYGVGDIASITMDGAINTVSLAPGDDPAITAKSNIPDYNDPYVVSETIAINRTNVYNVQTNARVSATHPYKSNIAQDTPNENRLVNTYAATRSGAKDEYFTDEQYRLPLSFDTDSIPSGITGEWDSTAALTDGNALIYNGGVQHGGDTNLAGTLPAGNPNLTTVLTSAVQQYMRAFYEPVSNPKSGVVLTLPGLLNANVGPVGSGDVNVEVKLPGLTGWLDAGSDFPGNFDSVKTNDGTGCRTAQSGNNWTLSFGTSSTVDSGGYMFVRVTFRNTNRVLQSNFSVNW